MEELSWYKCNFTPGNIYRYDAGDFISFPSLSNKANHSLLMVNYLRYFLLERDSKLVEKKPFIYKLDRRFSIAPSWRFFFRSLKETRTSPLSSVIGWCLICMEKSFVSTLPLMLVGCAWVSRFMDVPLKTYPCGTFQGSNMKKKVRFY